MKTRVLMFFFAVFVLLCVFSPQNVFSNSAPVKLNPVSWKTDYDKFSSSNFYIRLGDKYFYSMEPINVHSDPGTQYTTLELMWNENGVGMRMFMYFKKTSDNMWELYDLRTYNVTGSDWIYYSPKDTLGNTVSSMPGYRNYAYERVFKPINNSIDAEIYCKDCSFTAFTLKTVPVSSYGYGIDFRIGLPANETITITTNPMTGYGVNALLVDSVYEVVKNQSNFEYLWSLSSDGIAVISPGSVPYPGNKCAYEILSPCPNFNVQIGGISPGIAQVKLDIKRKTDGVIVASNSFDVKVLDEKVPVSSSVPTPNVTPDPKTEKELNELRGEVGKLNTQVKKQGEDIGLLTKIVNSILEFIKRIFPEH